MFFKCFSSILPSGFQVGYRFVSDVFQVCFKRVSSVFQVCFKRVSSVPQVCLKCVSSVFRGEYITLFPKKNLGKVSYFSKIRENFPIFEFPHHL